jgi:tetratricopeptide (TPR) repeat protein
LRHTGRPKEGEDEFRQGLQSYEKLMADFPGLADYASGSAATLNDLALALQTEERLPEARQMVQKAITLQRKALEVEPSNPQYRQFLGNHYSLLSEIALAQDNAGSVAKEAEDACRQALQVYKKLVADFPAVRDYRKSLGAGHNRLGILLHETGRPKEAEDACRQALQVYEKLAADFPALPEYASGSAATLHVLAQALQAEKRLPDARQMVQKAIVLQDKALAVEPGNPQYRQFLGNHYLLLSGIALAQDNVGSAAKEAEEALREALQVFEKLAADFPTVPGYRKSLGASHFGLVILLHKTGRPKEVEDALRQALPIFEKLAADFPSVAEHRKCLAVNYNALGELLMSRAGQRKEADEALRQALQVYEKLVVDFPTVPDYQKDLADLHNSRGNLMQKTRRPKEAEDAYRQGLQVYEKLATDFPTMPVYRKGLANSHYSLGVLLSETRRQKEAEDAYREGLRIYEKLAADFPTVPDYRDCLGNSYHNLGDVLLNTGRSKEAEEAFRQAIRMLEKQATDFPASPQYASSFAGTLNDLALALKAEEKLPEARQMVEKAVTLQNKALEVEPGNAQYRQFLRNHYSVLSEIALALNDAESAAKAALELQKLYPRSWEQQLRAARLIAQCVRVVSVDSKLSNERRRELIESYEKQVVGLLQDAVQNGFKEVSTLPGQEVFGFLAVRPDFWKLVQESASKATTPAH